MFYNLYPTFKIILGISIVIIIKTEIISMAPPAEEPSHYRRAVLDGSSNGSTSSNEEKCADVFADKVKTEVNDEPLPIAESEDTLLINPDLIKEVINILYFIKIVVLILLRPFIELFISKLH